MHITHHNYRRMCQGRNWSTFGRKFYGDDSKVESPELKKMICQHPEINYVLNILSDWWQFSEQVEEKETEQAFERLLRKIKNEP